MTNVTIEKPGADTLFEVSWEVCNKVGGIYTVVRSKVPFIKDIYRKYFLIGPSFDQQSPEFDPRPTPPDWQPIFQSLEKRGVRCSYGAWLVAGEPAVILVDSKGLLDSRGDIKYALWERFHIDSLHSSWEFDEPMCFATAAGMIIEEYANASRGKERIVAQCHEWIAGFALLHLKRVGARVATVFTTHATMLGRTIAGNGNSLYEIIDTINPIEWAYRYNVQDKHLTEVACAHAADVFTTVSEITGMEANLLWGRKPDVLLYNGFFSDSFPTFEETSIRHAQSNELLKEFIAYHFFPYYAFDLDKTVIFFTSGRYEFQNKGMDVLIDALGRLNKRLKDERADITVVFFFWVIMGRQNVRFDVLENKNFYQHIKSSVDWKSKAILQHIVFDFLSGRKPGQDDLFTSSLIKDLHADARQFHRTGLPPLATHDIGDWGKDPIVNACKALDLLNDPDDKVKIVLYPGYLDGNDGLMGLHYYDATVGAHLGVFPSSYEPWGYTPLESAVLGVPAVTTDLAGFGRYVNELGESFSHSLFVLERFKKSREDVINRLTQTLWSYSKLNHAERVQHGFAAKSLASMCDWSNFVKHYIKAHNLALEKSGLDMAPLAPDPTDRSDRPGRPGALAGTSAGASGN